MVIGTTPPPFDDPITSTLSSPVSKPSTNAISPLLSIENHCLPPFIGEAASGSVGDGHQTTPLSKNMHLSLIQVSFSLGSYLSPYLCIDV
ncbi:hypothetical protein HanHA300_Chr15g0580691 [Helianthus annuus]|nr:hypothetical protein HanHA300_Chr15g0580691 [Helianthus annuus]KAJ0474503.1 hypothetical protein HanHA89_Chr15g0630411 [Helianthus annuus]KAJ0650059.1 hypothetical protein HanLR1_Chr15g0591321 [Helianthus annuus]